MSVIEQNAKWCRKEDFSVSFNILLVVKFDPNLISSPATFTSTSLRSKDFTIKLKSLISSIPGGRALPTALEPIFFREIYLTYLIIPIYKQYIGEPYILLFLFLQVFHF